MLIEKYESRIYLQQQLQELRKNDVSSQLFI